LFLPKILINSSSKRLIFGLVFLSLISIIGLDYLAYKQGNQAYFFSSRAASLKTSPPSLFEEIFTSLEKLGLPKSSLQHHLDKQRVLHLLINLPDKNYSTLAPKLKHSLSQNSKRKIKIEAHQLGTTQYYLWTITGEKDTASLLFQLNRPKPSPLPQKLITSKQLSSKNKVAIIIDDLGNSLQAIDAICNLGFPVTVSILPYSLFAPETAQIAHQHGLEILLHLPLEPLPGNHPNNNSLLTPNGGMITAQMKEPEIIAFIDDALRQVPHIVGVNNHQGSLITANPKIMKIILLELQKRGLFFVDSRTTSQSVAYQMARSLGLPTTYRKIFLDNEVNSAQIKDQLVKLLQRGRREGWAVAIGHPWAETLSVLKENRHLFSAYDCQPVFVSELVH